MTARAAVLRRLASRAHLGGIVGVNVGANKDSADRVADYVQLIETFAPVASYFTVNVSSPNTPGLRNLQQAAALDDLLAKVIDARERVRQNAGDSPVLLKIAPDLSLTELDDVVHIARSRRVDGMIVANTTLARPSTLREQSRAGEQGGLSGRPLFRLSTRMVAETYVRAEGAFPLIGVGGIDTGGAALTKIRAGASLIQLYSSLIYKGLGLVDDIKNDLDLDAAAHRARLAVRNRRRRCRDDHGRGLAGLDVAASDKSQLHCRVLGSEHASLGYAARPGRGAASSTLLRRGGTYTRLQTDLGCKARGPRLERTTPQAARCAASGARCRSVNSTRIPF